MLTINYIRAQHYADASWDMILGMPREEFAQFAEQQAPELEQLQTLKNVQIPAIGESVDLVHLVAGIGATYKRMSVVCTWGGDCIQLAGSIQGTGADEEDCIQQPKPYFAREDENASLMPQSGWLADLDEVNIGSTLKSGDDLSGSIGKYYESITNEERARRFVPTQFGETDTGNQQVKDKFFADSGIRLLLSQKQMTLDEGRNIIAPLRYNKDKWKKPVLADILGVQADDLHNEETTTNIPPLSRAQWENAKQQYEKLLPDGPAWPGDSSYEAYCEKMAQSAGVDPASNYYKSTGQELPQITIRPALSKDFPTLLQICKDRYQFDATRAGVDKSRLPTFESQLEALTQSLVGWIPAGQCFLMEANSRPGAWFVLQLPAPDEYPAANKRKGGAKARPLFYLSFCATSR